MAQLPATKRELKKSFAKHFHIYKEIDPTYHPMTRRLLLFYSVESGLKCFLLDKIHKNTTDELKDYHEYRYLKEHGHDIKNLIKSAGIGGQDDYKLEHFLGSSGQQIEPGQLHQVWRYGIEINSPSHENKSEMALKNIADWLNDGRI